MKRAAFLLVMLWASRAGAGELSGVIERGGRRMEWRAWIPDTTAPVPLLVGLHGRSRHLESYRYYFLDVGREAPADLPVAVVAPKLDWDAPWLETQGLLFALVDELVAQHPIDSARVSILGFSMGASSALHLARHNPRRFSAVWAASGLFPDDALAHLRRLGTRVLLSWSGGPSQCVKAQEQARAVDRGRGEARSVVFPGGRHEPHLEMFHDRALLAWFVGAPR